MEKGCVFRELWRQYENMYYAQVDVIWETGWTGRGLVRYGVSAGAILIEYRGTGD